MCARAQGLRTLLLATRVLGADEWAAWNARYQAAAGSLEKREQRIAQARRRATSRPVQQLLAASCRPGRRIRAACAARTRRALRHMPGTSRGCARPLPPRRGGRPPVVSAFARTPSRSWRHLQAYLYPAAATAQFRLRAQGAAHAVPASAAQWCLSRPPRARARPGGGALPYPRRGRRQVAEEVEHDLELVGMTAIEDKLQAGVPEAIRTLITAGMRARARPRSPRTPVRRGTRRARRCRGCMRRRPACSARTAPNASGAGTLSARGARVRCPRR